MAVLLIEHHILQNTELIEIPHKLVLAQGLSRLVIILKQLRLDLWIIVKLFSMEGLEHFILWLFILPPFRRITPWK